MCVITLLQPQQKLDKQRFDKMWTFNPHGGGLMYAKNGELQILKSQDRQEFWGLLKLAEEDAQSPIGVHFRISTSGKVDIDNCHPFLVNEGVALMHNGILPVTVPKKSLINDTQIFIKRYLQDLDFNLKNKALMMYLGRSIGDYNKFLLMDKLGNVEILNPDVWKDDDGLLVSNMDYYFSKQFKNNKFNDLWLGY